MNDKTKTAIFEAVVIAMRDLMDIDPEEKDMWSPEYAEAFGRFSGLYDLVEDLGIEDAYQAWKKENGIEEVTI